MNQKGCQQDAKLPPYFEKPMPREGTDGFAMLDIDTDGGRQKQDCPQKYIDDGLRMEDAAKPY